MGEEIDVRVPCHGGVLDGSQDNLPAVEGGTFAVGLIVATAHGAEIGGAAAGRAGEMVVV